MTKIFIFVLIYLVQTERDEQAISTDKYLSSLRLGQTIAALKRSYTAGSGTKKDKTKSSRLTIALARISARLSRVLLPPRMAAELELNSVSPSPDTIEE